MTKMKPIDHYVIWRKPKPKLKPIFHYIEYEIINTKDIPPPRRNKN